MKKNYSLRIQIATIVCSLLLFGFIINVNGQLPFSDGFETGNFTSGGWAITGNAEISTQSPAQGNYCVKGPGTYGIEKSFNNLNEAIITVEFSMKASQTGSNCVVFGIFDENDYESAVVLFRHTGNIEAKDGPSGSTSIALMEYQADTWYNMKIVLDFTNKTYDVYIDDILKADDFGFYEPSYGIAQSFKWRSGETWGTGWIDDVQISGEGPYANLPFEDCFESGNFTTGGWAITGNAEISTDDPYEGSYGVKGPGTYSLEKSFNNLNEEIITVEFAMKASQTGSNCIIFGVYDENNYESAVVLFRHTGNIEAKDGPSGSNATALMQYDADVWYNMEIILDFTSKTYDVIINDESMANDFGFYDPNYGTPQSFNWRSGETWGTGWIDCVEINDGYVGIEHELANLENINIFPNPVLDILNIKGDNISNCKIYSLTGNLVKTISCDKMNTRIDISDLLSGMYLLNLMDTKGNLLKSKKIIKE